MFAILYVIGLIISLVGTGFLIGFGKQIKQVRFFSLSASSRETHVSFGQMFNPVRAIAAVCMLGCISACHPLAIAAVYSKLMLHA